VASPQDDFPHPVPPQAFMTWKENWVFPAVDRDHRSSVLFHVSLRPVQGEGIFTAKFHVDGTDHRHVSRSPIPRNLDTLHPIADEHVRFTIVKPGQEFRLQHSGDTIDADLTYRARWPVWDFKDGPRVQGSTLGEIGNTVFPFHHVEQALTVSGTLTITAGHDAGRVIEFSGYGNRDHSWGFRDDFQFRHHHWLCANFADRFVQGSVMLETSYPGEKVGGWVSSDTGNVGVQAIDTSEAYWLVPDEPLGDPRRDMTYRLTTTDGRTHLVTAHLQDDYGRLFLNARSADRSELYMDVQIFCDFTDEQTGDHGVGVLELGKYLSGDGVADRHGRRPT
jgi:hypothetical protein